MAVENFHANDNTFAQLLGEHLSVKVPSDLSMDLNERETFLMLCDSEVRPVIRKVLNNTLYISFEDLRNRLEKLVKSLLEREPNTEIFYVLDSSKETKDSEKYTLELVKEIINNLMSNRTIEFRVIQQICEEDTHAEEFAIPRRSIVLIIDDCIYTGSKYMNIFQDLYKHNLHCKGQVTFYPLVPIMGNLAWGMLLNGFGQWNQNTYSNFILLPETQIININLTWLLTPEECNILKKYYTKHLLFPYRQLLVYFDHKIASDNSTVTWIYTGLIANSENKSILEKVNYKHMSQKDLKREFDKLHFHNFMKGCRGKRNYRCYDVVCPNPPYKDPMTQAEEEFVDIHPMPDYISHKALTNKRF